ncbi:MAG: hypothetical protein L0Z62_46890 [Gemmataceae bacterium]|nr:hypothetical protein [Gemmataceae bacterium]
MISVEFRAIGPGTCMWCKREKDEVLTVAFSDKSFSGPMCRGDFFKALSMKIGNGLPLAAPAFASGGQRNEAKPAPEPPPGLAK